MVVEGPSQRCDFLSHVVYWLQTIGKGVTLMQYCPHCGKMLEADSAYCPHCGKALRRKAPPRKLLVIIGAVLAVVIAGVLLLGALGTPFSEDPDAIEKASASVVTVYTYDVNGIPTGSGSGFAAFEEGLIVTNYHVIAGDTNAIEIVAESGDAFYADSILCHSQPLDIAVLYVPDCTLRPLALGSSSLEKGETLTAIGSPKGIHNAVSTGIFSTRTDDYGQDYLMTTASISHGSSGGALFNESGEVVGVTSALLESGNDLYFAIPAEYLQELYRSRTPEDELSIEAFWELSEHVYTVDYVLANARALQGKEIIVAGYLSAKHYSGYLVSSPDLVLGLDTNQPYLTDDLVIEMLELIEAQNENGISLRIDTDVGKYLIPELQPGEFCTAFGKVMIYNENSRGTDIRLITESVQFTP